MKQKIYLVHHNEAWDGENCYDPTMAFKNEDDALAEIKWIANQVRADWANECVEETDHSFHAWREGEYDKYHCEIFIQYTELL